jgi:hypothetical protein
LSKDDEKREINVVWLESASLGRLDRKFGRRYELVPTAEPVPKKKRPPTILAKAVISYDNVVSWNHQLTAAGTLPRKLKKEADVCMTNLIRKLGESDETE